MTAQSVLKKAAELVSGDRAEAHGGMRENHDNIAQLWNGYLHNVKSLTAHDVANMMELLKIARRKNGNRNEDDYVDGAGYAAVAYECAEQEAFRENMTPDEFAFFKEREQGVEDEKEP